jgi:CRISPR-associated protein Cmr6
MGRGRMKTKNHNLQYQYYFDFFKNPSDVEVNLLEAKIEDLCIPTPLSDVDNSIDKIKVKVMHPGLVIGLANPQPQTEKKDKDKDKEYLKSGFFFDYATGVAIIPGSAIKGALRSIFFQSRSKNNAKTIVENFLNISVDSIDDFRKALFGDDTPEDEREENASYETNNNPALCCFDAFPISSDDGKLFAFDNQISVRPDRVGSEQMRKGKNMYDLDSRQISVNKLKFLKVKDGVCFLLQFKLKDFEFCGETVRKDKLLELIKYLIKLNGLGAKTGEGFGAVKIMPH